MYVYAYIHIYTMNICTMYAYMSLSGGVPLNGHGAAQSLLRDLVRLAQLYIQVCMYVHIYMYICLHMRICIYIYDECMHVSIRRSVTRWSGHHTRIPARPNCRSRLYMHTDTFICIYIYVHVSIMCTSVFLFRTGKAPHSSHGAVEGVLRDMVLRARLDIHIYIYI